MKRLVSLMLVFSIILPTFAVFTPKARATGTREPIYIRADGSVDPSTAPITRNGDIYTLTDNIISVGTSDYWYSGITIEKNGVTLDGAGFMIQGTGFNSEPYAYAGVELFDVSDVTVMNVAIKNFMYCILLSGSSRNIIERNTLTGAVSDPIGHGAGCGVFVACYYYPPYPTIAHESHDNSISGNTIVDCPAGISVMVSSGNRISGNTVTASNGYGVDLFNASNNVLDGNVLTNNSFGIYIGIATSNVDVSTEMTDSSKNILFGNSFEANDFAVAIIASAGRNCSGNAFYRNNFVNNSNEVVGGYPSVDSWDDGYPSGGNYWSDYNGSDVYSGPYQNETGSDGIGDTPYVIDRTIRTTIPL